MKTSNRKVWALLSKCRMCLGVFDKYDDALNELTICHELTDYKCEEHFTIKCFESIADFGKSMTITERR